MKALEPIPLDEIRAARERIAGSVLRTPLASSFVRGAWSGTTTAQGMPSRRAFQAAPCAILPALATRTPLASSAFDIALIALAAPRILNDPMGWRFSSLR